MLIFKKYGKGTEKVRIRTIERNVSFLHNNKSYINQNINYKL